MLPPIFSLLSTNATVGALLGVGAACRVYPFGEAKADVVSPYATWFVVAGAPENTQDDTPSHDRYAIQMDVWGDENADVVAAARAVRDAIETVGYVTQYNPSDADPATGRKRISFDAELHISR